MHQCETHSGVRVSLELVAEIYDTLENNFNLKFIHAATFMHELLLRVKCTTEPKPNLECTHDLITLNKIHQIE